MLGVVSYRGSKYEVNFDIPLALSIPYESNPFKQVNCFGAPFFESTPVRSGEFVGSIKDGGFVNFYNLKINPHGNGTHTETLAHIVNENIPIRNVFQKYHFVAQVISVFPTLLENGDKVITKRSLISLMEEMDIPEAVVIRTYPNDDTKLQRQYTDTNPPYFEKEALEWMRELGVEHLLCDLPSVDREYDDARFEAHKAFWGLNTDKRISSTITELVFVGEDIKDGLYLLNFQILPLPIDASPSNPVLYKMSKVA